MLKNNKGFTVVELVTSFALAMVVFVFLFEIVVTLKDLYINSGYKTELLYKQAMISNKINTTLTQKKIKIAMTCGDDCLFFIFDDNTTSKLQIDKENNIFTWGDYTTKLVANSYFGDININSITATNVGNGKNDSIINIKIPIYSANITDKDFGVNIVYQYDSRISSITGIDAQHQTDGTKAIYLNGAVDDVKTQGNNYNDPGYFVYYADGSVVYNDPIVTVTSTPTDVLGESYDITYSIIEEGVPVATMTRTVTVVGTYTYNYTGSVQTFTAPIEGYYKIELWGGGTQSRTKGGYTSGVIHLEQGNVLYVYVGQQQQGGITTFAFNGGGSVNTGGNSGAGATDIRLVSGSWDNIDSLKSRIMVAGGAGGQDSVNASYELYGNGGNLIGQRGLKGTTDADVVYGGTQISGGQSNPTTLPAGGFGFGGIDNSSTTDAGAGGGGGYYGGGAAATWGAGAGGSSFISGYAGVNAITNSATLTHSNNTIHYSNYYFVNGQMQSSVNLGNGKATITYVGRNYYKQNNDLNGVRYIKDCINGSTTDNDNRWVELQAIVNGKNVALGKNVTGTVIENTNYPYSRITDGDINPSNYALSSTTGLKCITVDLGNIYNLDEVAVWHYYSDNRTYNDHTLSVSLNNTDWKTIINNNEPETDLGKRYSAYINYGD